MKHFRDAFKIFDRNKDGFISTKELKRVTTMLGTMLSKEEVDEFMAEADVVGHFCRFVKVEFTAVPTSSVLI